MSGAQKWFVVSGGMAMAFAAYVIAKGKVNARKPIPVKVAVEKLQQAWADHHTYA